MNKKRITTVLFLLLIVLSECFSGHDQTDHGARSGAMAGSDVALSGFWSLRNNQAGMAYITDPTGGLFYENRYGLSELGYQSAGFVYPMQSGAIGVSANYFGDQSYHESAVGLAYGMEILDGVAAGIQIQYLSSFADTETGTGNTAVTFEAGLLYNLSDDVTLGVHTYNPLQNTMNSASVTEIIPSVYSLGVVFRLSDGLLVSSEIEKIQDYGESVRIGVEYEVVEKTYLRTGAATHPGIFSFGFETTWNKLTFQLASTMHEVLGFSPLVSVLFKL